LSFVPGKRQLAENIASGAETAGEVVEGWMESPVHRRNVLGKAYAEMGVGYWPGGSAGLLLGRRFRGRLRRDSPAASQQEWGRAPPAGLQSLALARSSASAPSDRARATSSKQRA
jgi:hypothetical protein